MSSHTVGCAYFVLALVVNLLQPTHQNELVVQTSSGRVEGTRMTSVTGQDLNVFFGIPFAAPPVGGLRFKPPTPVSPSEDVIKAFNRSKACLQTLRMEDTEDLGEFAEQIKEIVPGKDETSEDCLYLNVWAPIPSEGNKSAVMVWIHGGAFEAGSGNSIIYDGQVIASERVVVVTINYRLGVFGFLSFDPEEIPGNMGLMDQSFAMKWVKDNIENFGGDANRITIFGESAGGGSVGHQLFLSSSEGLFQRAILQSGTATAPWGFSSKKEALHVAELIIEASGCNNSSHSSIITCLKEASSDDLIQAAIKATTTALVPLNPTVDGVYIPEDLTVRENRLGFSKDLDLLIGATNDDGAMFAVAKGVAALADDAFVTEENFTTFLNKVIQSPNPELVSFTKFLYTDWENESDNFLRPVADFMTDLLFLCPSVNTANHGAANGNKVYYYELEHRPANNHYPKWSRVSHADDLPIVFGQTLLRPERFSPHDKEFSKKVVKYWTNFAKTGNPNFEGNETWPLYTLPEKKTLSLQMNEQIKNGIRHQRCAFIKRFLPYQILNLG